MGKSIDWNKDSATAIYVGDGPDESSLLVPNFAIFAMVDQPYFVIGTSFSQSLEDALLKLEAYFKRPILIAALVIDIKEDRLSCSKVFPEQPASKPFINSETFL
jgi:hypothetical protein